MAFLGMRGTGDWATNQRPENWRQAMLFLNPNGAMTLTGIGSMFGSEPTTDPKFHWWTKRLPEQAGDVTNVYTDAALSAAYTSGGDEGEVVYVKMALALAKEFREGHMVKLGKKLDYRHDTVGEVIAVVKNGANSYVAVELYEDAVVANDLDAVDYINIIGDVNEEGAEMPQAIGYDPVQYTQVTQIIRTPLSITRTARMTKLRTGDAYAEMKREALQLHGMGIEKARIWSVLRETTGPNGKPKRSMDGIVKVVRREAPGNVDSFALNTDYSGQSWIQGGEEWLDEKLETIFRYGSMEKLAVTGSEALRGVNRLAKAAGQIQLNVTSTSYGLKVVEWVTPFGVLFLKTHPLFSYDAVNRRNMLIIEPANFKDRIVTETKFKRDNSENENTNNSKDSTDEEFLTEMSYEYHFPETAGYLVDFNQANSV